MINWIYNSVTVKGSYNELNILKNTGFNFQNIHPSPETSEDEVLLWQIYHWGTAWPARNIIIEELDIMNEVLISIKFKTAWSPPHGLLAYLTQKYGSLEILNEYFEDCDETYGSATYFNGIITNSHIHPYENKLTSLKEFSTKNSWFDYEAYVTNIILRRENIELFQNSDYPAEIELYYWTKTYEEYVAYSEENCDDLTLHLY
jgi:hypothetical protein